MHQGQPHVYFHIHLVSDATGETVNAVARAACAQFEAARPFEHVYPLVRTAAQVDQILQEIANAPGLVLFTIVDKDIRDRLEAGCNDLGVPSVSVLDPIFTALGAYLGAESNRRPGGQHAMDAAYFHRMEALTFAMAHDDAQRIHELNGADVVLVGVSRTSKTPTCIYLANRGLKAANVPVVPGQPLPRELEMLDRPLVVGLTVGVERLLQIRRNRLQALGQDAETVYVNRQAVRDEVAAARRMFEDHGWPIIDVTRRSIEETAAAVLALHRHYAMAGPLPSLDLLIDR